MWRILAAVHKLEFANLWLKRNSQTLAFRGLFMALQTSLLLEKELVAFGTSEPRFKWKWKTTVHMGRIVYFPVFASRKCSQYSCRTNFNYVIIIIVISIIFIAICKLMIMVSDVSMRRSRQTLSISQTRLYAEVSKAETRVNSLSRTCHQGRARCYSFGSKKQDRCR